MKATRFKFVDPILLAVTILLLIAGTVMIYSSSSLVASENFASHMFYLKRHAIMLFLGTIAMLIAFVTPLHVVKKITFPVLIIFVVLLIFVIATSMGVEAKHATRWINIAGFRFQPSELIKPWIILFTAGYIERMGIKIRSFKDGLFPLMFILGMILLLILKQPDFGTTVTIAVVLVLMVFVSGAKWTHLGSIMLTGGIAAAYLIFSADYRRRRFFSFINPWADPQGDGFQMIQSLVAFQRGGLKGQGLGDGTQKLLYLPEAHTDFIFSVIGEELGFLGCMIVVLLFCTLMIQGIRLAIRIQDPFASILAFGLTMMITVQAVFNMGVVTGLLPTKGLTLPFISYGGSSLIATMFSMGLLLSLSSMISHQRSKIGRVL